MTGITKPQARAAVAEAAYRRHAARNLAVLAALTGSTVAAMLAAMRVGATGLGFADVAAATFCRVLPGVSCDQFAHSVVWNLRMPRVVMGVLAGSGLAVAGVAMQGVTRNPLVSPFTIGVSSAAAFGASLAIFAGASLSANGGIAVVASAFACSMLCVLVVFGLARVKRAAPETVILAGIAISYLFAALTAVIQFFADQQQLQAMVHWTFGTLNATRWSEIWPVAPVLALVLPVLVKTAWDLNVMMEAGDEVAKTLGIDVRRVRGKALLLGTLLASTITCFTGIIAFVGLVAPHITRFLVGADNRYVLPGAATVGATLVVLADSVGRTVLAPVQLPIGIVISFVGVPVFLYLLMHRGATAWQ